MFIYTSLSFQDWQGHKLVTSMSLVGALRPLKTRRVQGLIHVKSAVAESPPVAECSSLQIRMLAQVLLDSGWWEAGLVPEIQF
ncbi:hypothetical protein TNCV_4966431 [Trichonephila clavipes]|nr:hypothetical protein TNCV_4966431 [Trichonephila clavipes]